MTIVQIANPPTAMQNLSSYSRRLVQATLDGRLKENMKDCGAIGADIGFEIGMGVWFVTYFGMICVSERMQVHRFFVDADAYEAYFLEKTDKIVASIGLKSVVDYVGLGPAICIAESFVVIPGSMFVCGVVGLICGVGKTILFP
jgi:hypothetical protein